MIYSELKLLATLKKLSASVERAAVVLESLLERITTILDQQERQQESDKAKQQLPLPALEVKAETHEEKTSEGKREARDNKHYRMQAILTLGTWLAFAAAAWYASTSRDQLEEARYQTKALKASVEIAHRSMVANERPWIGPVHPIELKSVSVVHGSLQTQFVTRMKNFGKTPALLVNGFTTSVTEAERIKLIQDITCKQATTFATQRIIEGKNAKGEPMSFSQSDWPIEVEKRIAAQFGMRDPHEIEPKGTTIFPGDIEERRIDSGIPAPKTPGLIYFVGCIVYSDAFSPKTFHETRFCEETPTRYDQLTSASQMLKCYTANSAN